MTVSTVVLTGATGSLGGATATELARRGVRLVLVGRNRERLEALAARLGPSADVVLADLADAASVHAAARTIAGRTDAIATLIHTAAVFRRQRTDRGGLEEMFLTNHLAPFILTAGLLDRVRAARGRVVTVTAPSTSRVNLADLQSTGRWSALSTFGMTKAANLLFSAELARRLKGTGATADAFHPGLVKTTLLAELPWPVRTLSNLVSSPPDRAARALVELALSPGVDGRARLVTVGRELPYPAPQRDPELQRQLWEVSELLAGRPAAHPA